MKKIILCCLIAALIMLTAAGCSNKKSDSAVEKDIKAQIESMLSVPESESEKNAFDKLTGDDYLFAKDENGRKISEKVSCKVDSVNVEGESGTVTLIIEAPDVYEILKESADELENEEDVDVLLSLVSQKLDGNYPKIKETVVCDIYFENEQWKLRENIDLLDALSGNLYSAYFRIADDVLASIEEE